MKRIKDFKNLTDEEIIERISSDNYEGGNVGLPENPTSEEIKKYQLGKKILTYQQESKLSLEVMSKKIAISENKLYDICRGKITDFTLKELISCLDKLEEKKFVEYNMLRKNLLNPRIMP